MKVQKTIEVGGQTVQVHELTVADIREALKLEEMEGNREEDVVAGAVDMFLLDGIALPDLLKMTDLTREAMETMTPTELKEVESACREVNADFFALRGKILRFADLVPAAAGDPAKSDVG